MSAISQKSISGITSITTPAGVDNVFTVHTNDTTERFRVDSNGNQVIAGILTASNHVFLTGGDLVINDVISHFGDGNSKIRFPADDTFTVETSGNERLRITSSGTVGVNCTPTAAPLEVKQLSADGGALRLRDSSATYRYLEFDVTGANTTITARSNNSHGNINIGTIDQFGRTTQLYIKGGANAAVGIGTDSPTDVLDVRGDIIAYTSSTKSVRLVDDGNIELTSNNGAIIDFKTSDSEDFDCRIRQISNGLQFLTGGNGSTDERLRITSSQTRIGSQAATDTTSYEIQLSGAANNDSILSLYNPTTNNGEGIHQGFFFKNSNDTVTEFARIKSTAVETTAATAKGDLRFYTRSGSGGISNSSERLRIASDGTITTLGTSARSDWITTTLKPSFQIGSGYNPWLSLFKYSNDPYGPYLLLGKTRGTSSTSSTVIQDGDELGNIMFEGTDGSTFRPGARIVANVDGTPGSGDMPTRLTFHTTPDGGNNVTERLRIDKSGNMGLGTISPDRKLDVSGTGNVYGKFQSTNATGAGIEVKDTAERWLIQADGGVGPGLAFYDLGRTSYRMLLNSSGKLLLGVTSGTSHHISSGSDTLNTVFQANLGGAGATCAIRVKMNTSANNGLQIQQNGSGTSISGGAHCASIINRENAPLRLGANNTEYFRIESNGHNYIQSQCTVRGELNMMHASQNQAKYMDIGFQDNSFNMRRTNYNDGGHSNFITVNSSKVVSGDFNDTSDGKLKKNIATITDGAIEDIKKLRPVTFDWIDETQNNNVSGFIAQEVKQVLPNLVNGTEYDPTFNDESLGSKGGIKSVGYSINSVGVTAHLTKALQEAIAKIEVLEAKVAALEGS